MIAMIPDPPLPYMQEFCTENNVDLVHVPVDRYDGDENDAMTLTYAQLAVILAVFSLLCFIISLDYAE